MLKVALPFLVALAAALALTPTMRRLAHALGMVAVPSTDRWHEKPTALLGGVAIFVAFAAGGAVTWLLRRDIVATPGPASPMTPLGVSAPWVGVFLAATVMFVVGLVDDRIRLNPATKLMVQAAAAAVLISFGVVYPVSPWVLINVLVTLFWFIAITNAMNLLDHMDGVAAGVAGIAAVFLGVTLYLDGAHVISAATFALAGAAFGFLPFNFPRASVFMGDAGSMFLGALLAGLGAAYPTRVPSASIIAVFFVPAIIVIIPIVDTALVTATRTLAGRRVSAGGRDHTSHRLAAMGFSERQVPVVLYTVATLGGLVALFLRATPLGLSLLTGGVFLVSLLLGVAYLARIHPYTPSGIERGRMTLMVADLVHKRRALEVLMDVVLFALAYQAAFLIRWDGVPPPEQQAVFATTVAVAVGAKSVAFAFTGVYRSYWHHVTLPDAQRIAKATLLGLLLTTVALVFLFREHHFGRGILVIDSALVLLLTVSARTSFRLLDSVRDSLQPRGKPVLIYGAGRGGALAARELMSNHGLGLWPIGFLDDDESKHGRLVEGIAVMGTLAQSCGLIERRKIAAIVIATRQLAPQCTDRLLALNRDTGIMLLQLRLDLVPARLGGDDSSNTPPVKLVS